MEHDWKIKPRGKKTKYYTCKRCKLLAVGTSLKMVNAIWNEECPEKEVRRYNDYQEHYYKTGKALCDLYCRNCKTLIFKKGERFTTSIFTRGERCCSNCDATLHRRSPGGQSDTWGLITEV